MTLVPHELEHLEGLLKLLLQILVGESVYSLDYLPVLGVDAFKYHLFDKYSLILIRNTWLLPKTHLSTQSL